MIQLSEAGRALLATKGRTAKRSRHQTGWVEETGLKVKKWKGHYYTYEFGEDGRERRVHRASILGLKSKMRKGEAQDALRVIIDREVNGIIAKPSGAVTLEWFFRERFIPIRKDLWKTTHADRTEYTIRRYVVTPFAALPLADVNRFDLQKHLNGLAKTASNSVVRKFVTWSRALFDEATDQGFIALNPARRLKIPETREVTRRALTIDEVRLLLAAVEGRDAVILRTYLVLGLRARELFALRRDDVGADRLRVDETVDEKGNFYKPKTASSKASVWLPPSLAETLADYVGRLADPSPKALLFATSSGRPVEANNWRKRVLQEAAKALGIEGVTIHALRRTCATLMMGCGDIKDIQAHLRHSRPEITAEVYVQEIPANVRAAVEKLAETLAAGNAEGAGNDGNLQAEG
ncbi:MAG: tyrosine-type recombinase/integrase [Acidobacteria bacterium]|nr:tyrosine-type recombinase/integrase [Acidobacteriota bacterium]